MVREVALSDSLGVGVSVCCVGDGSVSVGGGGALGAALSIGKLSAVEVK